MNKKLSEKMSQLYQVNPNECKREFFFRQFVNKLFLFSVLDFIINRDRGLRRTKNFRFHCDSFYKGQPFVA